MRTVLLSSLLLPACGMFAGPGDLDANFQPVDETAHAGVGGNTERGQGFTIVNSGDLAALTLWIKGATTTAPLTVWILPVDEDGFPLDEPLAEQVVPGGAVPEESVWYTVSFESPAAVVAGERYAWAVASSEEDDWNYGLLGANLDAGGNTYDDGDTCERVTDNYEWKSCHDGGELDYGFKVWIESGE